MQFQTLGYISGGVELFLSSPREGLVWVFSEKHFSSASYFIGHDRPGLFPQGHLWQVPKVRTCLVLWPFLWTDLRNSPRSGLSPHLLPISEIQSGESPFQLGLKIHQIGVPQEIEWGRVMPLSENLESCGRMKPASQSRLTSSACLPELHANVWSSEFPA